MKKYLIGFEGNWADEMDVSGLRLIDQTQKDSIIEKLNEKSEGFDIFIGTNEQIYFGNGKQLLDELKFLKISNKNLVKYETILSEFNLDPQGICETIVHWFTDSFE